MKQTEKWFKGDIFKASPPFLGHQLLVTRAETSSCQAATQFFTLRLIFLSFFLGFSAHQSVRHGKFREGKLPTII